MAASFGKLAEEALSSGQDLDAAIDEALACPCVAELREGPCGEAFAAAFRCFVRSQDGGGGDDEGEKREDGAGCGLPYGQLQECIQKHPAAFAEFMKSPEEEEEEEETGGSGGSGGSQGGGDGNKAK